MTIHRKYDSRPETFDHIRHVQNFISRFIEELLYRSMHHDKSKLQDPERSMYDAFTPQLKQLTYGSDEYKETLAKMGTALQHHYAHNSHHPEHYEDGINGMNLLDILEMLADWKAATLRHNDGNITKSLEINRERFHIDDQLYTILKNTIEKLHW